MQFAPSWGMLIEPASIDILSGEVKKAVRPDTPPGYLAGIQSKSNPAGAVLRGAVRAYFSAGRAVTEMRHPILGVITEWYPKPARVEI